MGFPLVEEVKNIAGVLVVDPMGYRKTIVHYEKSLVMYHWCCSIANYSFLNSMLNYFVISKPQTLNICMCMSHAYKANVLAKNRLRLLTQTLRKQFRVIKYLSFNTMGSEIRILLTLESQSVGHQEWNSHQACSKLFNSPVVFEG